MVGNILVKTNLFLAIRLQPDLIIRAILQVASIFRSKLKIEIEQKFYSNATYIKQFCKKQKIKKSSKV